MSPVEAVQAQLDAYNAQDIAAFCAAYADDAVLATFNGAVLAQGLDAVRARHEALFAQFPQNTARLLDRFAVGDRHVIDHEDVARAPGGERFQVGAIYSFKGDKIARVDFARGSGAQNTPVVAAQVDAYNARDVEKMCGYYTEDCVFADLNGEVRQQGRERIRARYAQTFAENPEDRAFIEKRFALGEYIIDDEQVERTPGGERIKIAAIYTIRDGLIARCDFAR